MSVGRERVLRLVRDLADSSSEARALAADRVGDWTNAYDDNEVTTVASALAGLILLEDAPDAIESQLHALGELADSTGIPTWVPRSLLAIDQGCLVGSALEHYQYLISLDPLPPHGVPDAAHEA